MEEILNILIKIAATMLCYGGYLLLKKGSVYIKEKYANEKLDKFIEECVKAAEQMYKMDDPSGSERLGYVQRMLIEAGYELTDALRATIESKVFEVNLANKGGDAK